MTTRRQKKLSIATDAAALEKNGHPEKSRPEKSRSRPEKNGRTENTEEAYPRAKRSRLDDQQISEDEEGSEATMDEEPKHKERAILLPEIKTFVS